MSEQTDNNVSLGPAGIEHAVGALMIVIVDLIVVTGLGWMWAQSTRPFFGGVMVVLLSALATLGLGFCAYLTWTDNWE